MIEIIPAILEKDFSEVAKKIKRLEQEAPDINWAQLDIMDGKFVDNTTWSTPEDLSRVNTGLKFEVHLMVEDPAAILDSWLVQKSVGRILFHVETVPDDTKFSELVMKVKEKRTEAVAVLNPDTSIDKIKNHMVIIDGVMFMGVHPGFSGQAFEEEVLNKIRALRGLYPQMNIAIDGGVSTDTAPRIISAGTNRLSANSALWNTPNIKEAVESLKMTVVGG